MVSRIVDDTFQTWTYGLDSASDQMVSLFYHIRDMPYAIVGKLDYSQSWPENLLLTGHGSCVSKHQLFAEYLHHLYIPVRFITIPFYWDDPMIQYPNHLRVLAASLPLSYHLACQVEVEGRWVLVDATWDPPLQSAGFPVNLHWDGKSDTLPAVTPVPVRINPDDPPTTHIVHEKPDDRIRIKKSVPDNRLESVIRVRETFLNALNDWLETLRRQTR